MSKGGVYDIGRSTIQGEGPDRQAAFRAGQTATAAMHPRSSVDTPDLLPCPFCGAQPRYEAPDELCPTPFIDCPTIADGENECGAYARSVAAWNTRTPQGQGQGNG